MRRFESYRGYYAKQDLWETGVWYVLSLLSGVGANSNNGAVMRTVTSFAKKPEGNLTVVSKSLHLIFLIQRKNV